MIEPATCKRCGAEYEVTRRDLPARDKDSINCKVCGEELVSWNGSFSLSAKLVGKAK